MRKVILVPTDFSEVCGNAALQAANLAELFNTDLFLVHALNHYTRKWLEENGFEEEYIRELLRQEGNRLTLGREIDIQTLMVSGTIYEAIPEAVSMTEAILSVVGTHGKTGMQHITGAKLLRVITATPVPTLVFQKRPVANFDKIMLPLNVFCKWEHKLEAIIRLCKLFKCTLFISETNPGVVHPDEHRQRTDRIAHILKGAGIDFILVPGSSEADTSKSVIELAVGSRVKMIVLMSDEEEGGTRFKPGPWDEKIIFNEAQIPVLCMNPFMV
ncbi:MAG: universal stress protein [Bacteroidales bacterium]|nr:universal stress protein [Bacteroidales bacterium]